MNTDADFDPVTALEALGVPNYEARVFIALQKLGSGSAKDVSSIADVPRSQVYGAAESLEKRGLIEIQHSTPKTYRPVSLEEAKTRLRERFERYEERAFDYLEQVEDDRVDAVEQQEGVWRLSGAAAIEQRTVQLIDGATTRVVYGANEPALMSTDIEAHLRKRSEAGVETVVLSDDAAMTERMDGLTVVPPAIDDGDQAGRFLLVDSDTILLSVLDEGEEVAIWSAHSGFARVLVPLVEDAMSLQE